MDTRRRCGRHLSEITHVGNRKKYIKFYKKKMREKKIKTKELSIETRGKKERDGREVDKAIYAVVENTQTSVKKKL